MKEGLKKAPGAPKRFKSSYILFFMHVQESIKKSLPAGTSAAPAVSKKASQLWKALSAEDRVHWDKEAAKEKQRYLAEKESYTGPWQVPHKRAKKDPTAPRRNASAFLLYSVKKRKHIKVRFPHLKNTDISRMLGEEWRKAPDTEKIPYIRQEEGEREQYKLNMAAWKKKKEAEITQEQKEPQETPVGEPLLFPARALKQEPNANGTEHYALPASPPTPSPASPPAHPPPPQSQFQDNAQNSSIPSLDATANEMWWSQNAGVEPPQHQPCEEPSLENYPFQSSHLHQRYSPIQAPAPHANRHRHAHANDAMFHPTSHHPALSEPNAFYGYRPENVSSTSNNNASDNNNWFEQNSRVMSEITHHNQNYNHNPSGMVGDQLTAHAVDYFDSHRFKLDAEDDCSPYGSYDEFDPVPIR